VHVDFYFNSWYKGNQSTYVNLTFFKCVPDCKELNCTYDVDLGSICTECELGFAINPSTKLCDPVCGDGLRIKS